MSLRASGLSPAIATPTCSSILNIFLLLLGAASLLSFGSSAASTTPSVLRMPTIGLPRFTSSRAYSTWYILPSGEKIVIAPSYSLPRDNVISPKYLE